MVLSPTEPWTMRTTVPTIVTDKKLQRAINDAYNDVASREHLTDPLIRAATFEGLETLVIHLALMYVSTAAPIIDAIPEWRFNPRED